MDGYLGDSTYGSYLSGQDSFCSGSSSSLTMSLSGSELLEDQPSTSGCSSDMAHSMSAALKERKKAQVKEYLRQLKEMVPPTGRRKRGRSGTINALQHVLQSFRKIQEEKTNPETEKNIDVSESGMGSSIYDTDDQIKVTNTISYQDQLVILVTPGDLSIVNVSSNMKNILGYPLDSWKDRDLLNFVNKKDASVVSSRLAQDFNDLDGAPEQIENEESASSSKFDTRSEQCGGKRTFFFRIRHFKGLDKGFSLTKADSYITFQAMVDVKYLEQMESNIHSPPLSLNKHNKEYIISTDLKKKVKYLQLNCVPLASAYADTGLSISRTFHTRHTLLCSYSYIHPNAIQLTGFLPHEMVGTSIFDCYHPDDMEQLYNIHKEVLSSKGLPFKSKPVRFRIKNGDWIFVETEWSSFVNPWSHHLEFIIGQHSVIKGPTHINIFDDTLKGKSTQLVDSALHYQQMIRELLIKPIKSRVKEVLLESVSNADDAVKESKTPVTICDKLDKEDKEISEITDKQKKFEISVSPEHSEQSSPELMHENECSMAYEQLNYTNSIKKFLLSQPKSLSSVSDKKESWPSSTEEEEEVPDFNVDISIPKPPSFGSSTKVLVSEQEPREDIVGSPAHPTEETEELSLKEAPVVNFVFPTVIPDKPQECDHHSQISLTQQALWKHTKLQEKLFIQQSQDDHNMVVIKRNDKTSDVNDSSPQRIKRSHSPDRASYEKAFRAGKSHKAKKRTVQDPPFPITTTDMKLTGINQIFGTQYQPEDQTAKMPGQIVTTAGDSKAQTTVTSSSGNCNATSLPTSMNNLQWPFLQQSAGGQLIPQVVSGFYQPGTGIFHTVNTISLSMQEFTSCAYNPSQTQATYTQATTGTNADSNRMSFKRPLSSDNSSSYEETSSSLLYLLESGSQTHSSSLSQDVPENGNGKVANMSQERKRSSEPNWLKEVNWTKDLQMQYILPKRKLNRVLMSDKEELCRMKQPDIVIHQMGQLEEEIDNSTSPIYDEEADYLFAVEKDKIAENSKKERFGYKRADICDDDYDHDHGINSTILATNFKKKMTIDGHHLNNNDTLSSSSSSKTESMEGNDNNLNIINRHESLSDTSQTDIAAPKSLDGESESVEMESICSKASSELTPSEQRSSEEAGSSMKESDSSSKDSDNGHRDSSESEMECKRNESIEMDNKSCYDKFFTPLNLHFKASDRKVAPWLKDTEMNDKIALEYSLKEKELDDVLQRDDSVMSQVNQSDLVINQFQALLCDLQFDCYTDTPKSSQTRTESCGLNLQRGDDLCTDQSQTEYSGMESTGFSNAFDKVFDGLFMHFPGTDEKEGEQSKTEPSFEDILD